MVARLVRKDCEILKIVLLVRIYFAPLTLSSSSSYSNRGCVVTGAGRGLGASLVLDLLAQGAKVAAISRQNFELQQLKARACDVGLEKNLFLEVGSTLDPHSTLNAISLLNDHGCGLNLLVANASVFGPRDSFLDCSSQDWEESILTNIFGLSRSVRAAIPALRRSSNAQIIVIGSAIGHTYSSHASAYAVSKAMAWSLVKCLSLELASAQIAVNEWIPGPLNTTMNPAAANLPVCRQPDDPLLLNFFRYLCHMQSPMPSGQSFSFRPHP